MFVDPSPALSALLIVGAVLFIAFLNWHGKGPHKPYRRVPSPELPDTIRRYDNCELQNAKTDGGIKVAEKVPLNGQDKPTPRLDPNLPAYPTEDQMDTMFNAYLNGGEAAMIKVLKAARQKREQDRAYCRILVGDKGKRKMIEKQGDGQKDQQMPGEKKQMIRGVQLAEPYPTDYEMETLFNAWKSEGKAGLVKALDSLHPEGWALD